MADVRLVGETRSAPWLPSGSTAEVWAGPDCPVPDPAVIVRLLVVRRVPGGARFFCVPTDRGHDLPTLRLGTGGDRVGVAEGLADLTTATLGRPVSPLRCVGYVRNVVPHPDAAYPFPTPWAHVPVFLSTDEPVVDGSWLSVAAARPELAVRHWWPIVEHHLDGADPAPLSR